jgi:hypothetical protein
MRKAGWSFRQRNKAHVRSVVARWQLLKSLARLLFYYRIRTSLMALTGEAMSEIIFIVEEAPEGGYAARALGESIFAQGENLTELQKNVRDAIACHFDEGQGPRILRLHFVKEEIFAL